MESELTLTHRVTVSLIPCNSCQCKTLKVVEKNADGKIISTRGSIRITPKPDDVGFSRVIYYSRAHGKGGTLGGQPARNCAAYSLAYELVLAHLMRLGYERV